MLAVLMGTVPLLRVPARRPQSESEPTSSADVLAVPSRAASRDPSPLLAAGGRG
jgi:hypothetical protein